MKKNKALVYLFNKIFNSGNLIDNIASKDNISRLADFYKQNFEIANEYNDFQKLMEVDLLNQLKLSKSAEAEFKKQFSKKMALQPAILNECYVIQSLANILGLHDFKDIDEKQENIPSWLFEILIRKGEGELESSLPRYMYFDEKQKFVLLQYGDSSSIDAIFVKESSKVRLEIKEAKSKLGEYDLNYDESGILIPTEQIAKNHKTFLHFIQIFNEKTTVFKSIGKNFKIGNHLSEEFLNEIVSTVFNTKKIDLYILQNNNKIYSIPSEKLIKNVDTNASEIRTCGRNAYNVFTPKNLLETIKKIGGVVENNDVTIPYIMSNETKGRGKNTITRYKINNLYFVKKGNFSVENNTVKFSLDKIKQNKASIAIHLYSILNLINLETISHELNAK